MAKLYGLGVGPGDQELLTVKAVRIIEKVDVIIAPTAMEGERSIALETAKEYIGPQTMVKIMHFPMGTSDKEQKVYEIYQFIESKLAEGKEVAFLTIGDPFLYSTYIHLLKYIERQGYEVETVPGIPSFCACASLAKVPLVVGDEPLLVLPATRIEEVRNEKFLVIMKVYKKEAQVIDFLENHGFEYVYVKRAGREGQEILTDRAAILNQKEYMALIIANRK